MSPNKSKTLPMVAAAAVVLILGGIGFMFAGSDSSSAEAEDAAPEKVVQEEKAPAVVEPVAEAPEPKPEPEPVKEIKPIAKTFTVNSQPASDVYENGEKVGQTPFIRKLEADDAPAFLELRKEGYKTQSVTVNPNGKVDQTFELEKEAPKRAPVRAKPKKKVSKPKAKKAPAPKKPKTEIPTW